jgi:hypothetical protein
MVNIKKRKGNKLRTKRKKATWKKQTIKKREMHFEGKYKHELIMNIWTEIF